MVKRPRIMLAVSGLVLALGIAGITAKPASAQEKNHKYRDWKKYYRQKDDRYKDCGTREDRREWKYGNRNYSYSWSYRSLSAWRNWDKIKDGKKVAVFGRVDSANDDEMTVKKGDKSIKVKLSNAKLYDKNGKKIDGDDIKDGNRVLVFGKKDGDHIDAQKVRDIDLDKD